MLKQKLSDRFSNIFNRDKKDKQDRQEEGRRDQAIYFNQSYFECKLVYNPHKLSLIKVIANILVGPDAGTPMMVSCKWLIKKNNHYSEIQGVTSSCYQPCIQDVGCSILVQITPIIEGKVYSGATISKQTGPLQLGSALQTIFTETKTKLYYHQDSIEFGMKIQAVFGKECQYTTLDYPQDGKLAIRKQVDNNFQIQISTAEFKTFFWITKEFPTLEFIRKSYNSVVISFTQFQSMRLAFKEGTDREVLALLLRTLTANSTLDWPLKQSSPLEDNPFANEEKLSIELEKQEIQTTYLDNKIEDGLFLQESRRSDTPKSEHELPHIQQKNHKNDIRLGSMQELRSLGSPPKEQSSVQLKQSSNMQLEMKVGELNTQINKLKKDYKELMKNYNLEKQNKCKFQHQMKKLQEKLNDFQKIQKEKSQLMSANQKLNEDNRFYRNQVTLLNKGMKKKEGELQQALKAKEALEKKVHKHQVAEVEAKKPMGGQLEEMLKNESENWRKLNNELAEQNEDLKVQVENLQNSLVTANKKLQSLLQEKVINAGEHSKSEPVIPSLQTWGWEAKEKEKDKIISNLMFKVSNLEMLLKHRSGERGNEALTLHKIINSLTEDITEKEEQLQQTKRINRQLMDRLKSMGGN